MMMKTAKGGVRNSKRNSSLNPLLPNRGEEDKTRRRRVRREEDSRIKEKEIGDEDMKGEGKRKERKKINRMKTRRFELLLSACFSSTLKLTCSFG